MTHHGGREVRAQIAKATTPTLFRLIEEHPDDPTVAELAIVTISHSAGVIVSPQNVTETKDADLKALGVPKLIRVFTQCMRKSTATSNLINHGLALLADCTHNCWKECNAYPSIIKLLVATLRSDDIIQRCIALGGLIRLYQPQAEDDQRGLDPTKFMAGLQRGFPDHLVDIIMDYGFDRCDSIITLQTTKDFQQALIKCTQDHDLRSLGHSLAQFILRTEFSITEGYFQTQCPRTGRMRIPDIGLPFTMWIDALPHCAAALRATKDPKEQDMADILELKSLIRKQRLKEAVDLAKKAFERSPDVAYFCYVVTLSADGMQGLRYAKKGMKCKSTSPFVRFQMMQRAVEHAANEGICILQNSPHVGEPKWEEGIAYLTSAVEDAKCYLDQAPPDNRHMKNVSYWYILLTIAIQGPELSIDLRELEVCFRHRESVSVRYPNVR